MKPVPHFSENLPLGVCVCSLTMHPDERGVFTEVFRQVWETGVTPVQWNVVQSRPGVLRGVHVHVKHDDYLIVISGRASIGLRDLRQGSPTEGKTALVEVSGKNLTAFTIPHGVAHGFYFHQPSIHIYAVSEYWNAADEFRCHWADPALEIPWPTASALVSPSDEAAPSLAELLKQLEPFQPISVGSPQVGVAGIFHDVDRPRQQ